MDLNKNDDGWEDVPLESNNIPKVEVSANDDGWEDVPLDSKASEGWQDIPSEKPGKVGSAIEGFKQGYTYGYFDEMAGHMEALGSKIGLRGLGSSKFRDIRLETDEEDKLSYDEVKEQARDKRRLEAKIAEEANPSSYLVGDFTGTLLSPAPTKIAAVPGTIGKMATLAGKGVTKAVGTGVGNTMAKAALMGVAQTAGRTEKDLASDEGLKELVMSGVLSAGTAGLLSGVGSLASKGSKSKVAQTIRNKLTAAQKRIAKKADEKNARDAWVSGLGMGDKYGEDILNKTINKLKNKGQQNITDKVSGADKILEEAIKNRGGVFNLDIGDFLTYAAFGPQGVTVKKIGETAYDVYTDPKKAIRLLEDIKKVPAVMDGIKALGKRLGIKYQNAERLFERRFEDQLSEKLGAAAGAAVAD